LILAGELMTGTAKATVIAAAMIGATINTSTVSDAAAQEHGPARGALVISGGAEVNTQIYDRFIELAGGPDALILVVPTSGTADSYDSTCTCLSWLKKAGARNLKILHTRDRTVANSDAFVEPLRRARGIWFAEGNAWRHQDAYLDTKLHRELFALLDRGGVIGGGSAGARIQSDFMPLRGQEPTNARSIPPESWRRGFRLLRNVIIDPHVLVRNRQFDMIGFVNAHPDMLGLGIDESTAIVVRGDTFEVVGSSYVLVYDNHHQLKPEADAAAGAPPGLFYFLRAGDTYNMHTRQSMRPSSGRPVVGTLDQPWKSP
jgi:cyanophycinase